MRIGLIFGGDTTEGEVSKMSASGINGSLQKLGYEVIKIEFDKNVALHILDANVDAVFNAMHGRYGEDGSLQGLLDIMKIPYTHSGLLASAIAMNKRISKQIFKDLGITTPKGIVVSKEELVSDKWKEIVKGSILKSNKELFIKPVCDGSSRDAFLVHDIDNFSFADKKLSTASKEFLIEEHIIGRELQVSVIGEKAIGVLEIIPNKDKSEFYDYNAKYNEKGAVHKVYDENEEIKQQVMEYAEKIHKAFGLKDISRSEFLLTKDNEIYALEVNSHPGFTPTSIVPEMANMAGISYDDLVEMLVKNAKYY